MDQANTSGSAASNLLKEFAERLANRMPTGRPAPAGAPNRWSKRQAEAARTGDPTMSTHPCDSERGQAMLVLLVATVLVTVISVALVGLMNTDMSHASVQYAVSRSFYIAQAGLGEAMANVFAASDPVGEATPEAGVTAPYGGGQFTYWVDAGPAAGCGAGLKTLEALGRVGSLGRMIPTRVRACAVPGAPFLAALFGESRVEFQGASR